VIVVSIVQVLMHLQHHGQFLPQLFQRLRTTQPGDENWRDAVAFLQEMCGLARHLQPNVRGQLYPRVVSLGLFESTAGRWLIRQDNGAFADADTL
jgi:protein phosphatase 4 regulatory subunit 3